jgi:hypothetical protein
MLWPHSGQAKRAENTRSAASPSIVDDQGQPVRELQGGLEGLGEALLEVVANLEAVHHHFDAVLFLLVQLRQVVEVAYRAVDPGADEAGGAQFLEDVQVLALALATTGASSMSLLPSGMASTAVDHLADGLRLQGAVVRPGSAACRRGRRAGAGSRRSR